MWAVFLTWLRADWKNPVILGLSIALLLSSGTATWHYVWRIKAEGDLATATAALKTIDQTRKMQVAAFAQAADNASKEAAKARSAAERMKREIASAKALPAASGCPAVSRAFGLLRGASGAAAVSP